MGWCHALAILSDIFVFPLFFKYIWLIITQISIISDISTLIKNRVGDDGVPAILQYRPSDLYLTDGKQIIEILQKDTHTSLVYPYLPQLHCWAIKKISLWNNLAWWPLPPASAVHPHASIQSDHQSPPRSTPPHLISHLSFFDEIVEIPVF